MRAYSAHTFTVCLSITGAAHCLYILFYSAFGIVSSLGLFTPLFCVIVAYTFFGLDALSEELEQPFGLAANDLPLSAFTRSTEIDLLAALGEKELSDPIQAKEYRLE